MFILVIDNMGYYAGKDYIFQGGKYPCCVYEKEESKIYKTRKIAQKVADRINNHTGSTAVLYEINKENDNNES